MRPHIICGIDVGNVAVKTVIAELKPESTHPHVLGASSIPSHGLRHGVVIDMEELIKNINHSIIRAEESAGVKVQRAYVSISGLHIGQQISRGVVIVARPDTEITQHDISRVVDAASTISLPANREIIHRIPRMFIIDGHEHVKDPLGMKGVRLEADVMLVTGLTPYIHNVARCINASKVEVVEFVFAPLALAKAVSDKYQREQGILNIDIGGGTSSLALFHEGEMLHSAILPIGSRHITNDLAVAFQLPIDKAEKIKMSFGCLPLGEQDKKDSVDLSGLVGEQDFVVPKKQIARIIDARLGELFDMISAEIKKVPYKFMLPAGLVLAGGGANMRGILQYAKDHLRLATRIGNRYMIEGMTDHSSDPSFAVATGLVLWAAENEAGDKGSFLDRMSPVSGEGVQKITRWLKSFMP